MKGRKTKSLGHGLFSLLPLLATVFFLGSSAQAEPPVLVGRTKLKVGYTDYWSQYNSYHHRCDYVKESYKSEIAKFDIKVFPSRVNPSYKVQFIPVRESVIKSFWMDAFSLGEDQLTLMRDGTAAGSISRRGKKWFVYVGARTFEQKWQYRDSHCLNGHDAKLSNRKVHLDSVTSPLTLAKGGQEPEKFRTINQGGNPKLRAMEFRTVPAGHYIVGSPESEADRDPRSERLPYVVSFSEPFDIQITEVTQAQWFEVMGNNPSHFSNPSQCPDSFVLKKNGYGLCPNYPVENVTFDEIKQFLQRLNVRKDGYFYRLPTEEEWETAARAGTTTPFSCGSEADLFKCAVYRGNSDPFPEDVGRLAANRFGIFDMDGNVREWVDSNFCRDNCDGTVFPKWMSNRKVIKGGAYDLPAEFSRMASRTGEARHERSSLVGFRILRVGNGN